jgi:hypothetical protein
MGADAEVAADVLEDDVAPVEHVIRVAARELDLADLDVQVLELVGERVELVHVAFDARVDVAPDVLELLADAMEIVHDRLGRLAHGLAHGLVVRLVGELSKLVEVAGHQAIEPFAVHLVEDVLGLTEDHVLFLHVREVARGVPDLFLDVMVVDAIDAIDRGALADDEPASDFRLGRHDRLLMRPLAGKPFGRRIGDVVTGRRDCRLRRRHPVAAGVHDVRDYGHPTTSGLLRNQPRAG